MSEGERAGRAAEIRSLVYGSIAVAAFSLTLPATRAAAPELGALATGLGRILVASAIAAAALLAARARLPGREEIRALLVVGGGVVFGFPLLTSLAMRDAPAVSGAIVVGLLPLATAAIGARRNHERPGARFWAAAVAGSGLVVAFALYEGAHVPRESTLAMFGAVLAAAVGYAEGGRLARTLGGWQTIAWALALSAPVAACAWLAAGVAVDYAAVSPRAWAGFAYVAVISQFLGFIPWYQGLRLGGIARVSQLQLFQVFLTLLFSAALLGETVSPETAVFALCVALCVWWGRKAPAVNR